MIRALTRAALRRYKLALPIKRSPPFSTASGPFGLGSAGQCLAEAKRILETTKDEKAVDAVFDSALGKGDLSGAQRAVLELARIKVFFSRSDVSAAEKLAKLDCVAKATSDLDGEGSLACLAARAEGLQILGRLKEIQADKSGEGLNEALHEASECLQTAGDLYMRALQQTTESGAKKAPQSVLGTTDVAENVLRAGATHTYLEAGRLKVRSGDRVNAIASLREGLQLVKDPKSRGIMDTDRETAEMMLGFAILELKDPSQASEAIEAFSDAQASLQKRVKQTGNAEDRSSLARCRYGLGIACAMRAAVLQQEVQGHAEKLHMQQKSDEDIRHSLEGPIAKLKEAAQMTAEAFEACAGAQGLTDREIVDAYQRAATGRAVLQDFPAAIKNAESAISMVEEILKDVTDNAERKELTFSLVNGLHMAGGFHADSNIAGSAEKGLEMCHRAYDLLVDIDEKEAIVTKGQIRQAQGLMSAKIGKWKNSEGYFAEAHKIFQDYLGDEEGLTQAAKTCLDMAKTKADA